MPVRPAAVAFDVIETLMPLEPLRDLFAAVGLPRHLLELWFTRTLRDGIALAATGDYAPFRQVAAHALRIVPGAVLATAGMLALVYALVRAPQQGWASARTIGELATAAVLLGAFAVTEVRRRDPLFPFSIFRARGLAAADVTQMIAFAGFVSLFFFLTLYMQDVLGYSPIRGGSAYLPVTAGIAVAAGISSKLFARTGTPRVIIAGSLIAAAGIYYLSRIPVHR